MGILSMCKSLKACITADKTQTGCQLPYEIFTLSGKYEKGNSVFPETTVTQSFLSLE